MLLLFCDSYSSFLVELYNKKNKIRGNHHKFYNGSACLIKLLTENSKV